MNQQSDSPTRKTLHRRTSSDGFQKMRRTVQLLFAALNLWLGLQFYLWVRFYERGGVGLHPARPDGVEGWLPIAGLMNTRYLLSTGKIPALHPAAMVLLCTFVLTSLLLKKAFCSWLCPIGTLSEVLSHIGKKVFGRNFRLPRVLDLPLRGLKYLLLGLFLFVTSVMSVDAIAGFLSSPYGLIADVKMLNFFRHMSSTALMVIALLALLSLLVENFWCRYLCPYGALMGLVSLLSPFKIRRKKSACIDCGKCARHCPAGLAVDALQQIRSAECMACMECLSACPADDALRFALPARESRPGFSLSPRSFVFVLALLFFAITLAARLSGHWQTSLPDATYRELIPHASELGHPGMSH